MVALDIIVGAGLVLLGYWVGWRAAQGKPPIPARVAKPRGSYKKMRGKVSGD